MGKEIKEIRGHLTAKVAENEPEVASVRATRRPLGRGASECVGLL
jgi:hypothetical protein